MLPAGRLQRWIREALSAAQIQKDRERDYIGFQQMMASNTLVIKMMLEAIITCGAHPPHRKQTFKH